jgi:hypothetical protein
VTGHLRRLTEAAAAAALIVLLAAPARADVDGGVPPGDAGVGVIDAAVLETLAPPPELAAPPDLSLPVPTAPTATTTVAGAPPPSEVEPPRPITRRLWFWLAVSGIIVAASVGIIAAQNPNTTRPDCPTGYVCPR